MNNTTQIHCTKLTASIWRERIWLSGGVIISEKAEGKGGLVILVKYPKPTKPKRRCNRRARR